MMIEMIQMVMGATFIALGIRTLIAMDRILKRLHKNYPDQWAVLGKPGGFFWWPKECSLVQGCTSRNRIVRQTLSGSCKWAELDSDLSKLRSRARTTAWAAVAAWAVATVSLMAK